MGAVVDVLFEEFDEIVGFSIRRVGYVVKDFLEVKVVCSVLGQMWVLQE